MREAREKENREAEMERQRREERIGGKRKEKGKQKGRKITMVEMEQ